MQSKHKNVRGILCGVELTGTDPQQSPGMDVD